MGVAYEGVDGVVVVIGAGGSSGCASAAKGHRQGNRTTFPAARQAGPGVDGGDVPTEIVVGLARHAAISVHYADGRAGRAGTTDPLLDGAGDHRECNVAAGAATDESGAGDHTGDVPTTVAIGFAGYAAVGADGANTAASRTDSTDARLDGGGDHAEGGTVQREARPGRVSDVVIAARDHVLPFHSSTWPIAGAVVVTGRPCNAPVERAYRA